MNIDPALDMAESIYLVRDLINLPANDLGPTALAKACRTVADECQASYSEIIGDELLQQNYPLVHAVGRACDDAPRLAEFSWGNKSHPKVTIVGKGVCFDTGGLNLKGGKSMGMMKKDMGGAAAAIGLARLIMRHNLPVRLRVLIPAVQNSVSANAFRPQDVLTARNGVTVEIGNTDAEGRLIMADALADADDEKPDLLIDMATLTGASRVALGPDIPSFFTEDDKLANALSRHAKEQNDPLWRLPMWEDYNRYISSEIADIDNSGSGGGYAGAITAALFLKNFVKHTKRWVHIDMMAWNTSSRPGRPQGGEAQGLRTLLAYIQQAYR
jgi:leucyl aminopeptidase